MTEQFTLIEDFVQPKKPCSLLNLKRFWLTLPTGGHESPDIIKDLTDFEHNQLFYIEGDHVCFQCPPDGVTTKGSHYPRTELRELDDQRKQAKWSTAQGTHTLALTCSVEKLTQIKSEAVICQIHRGSDDLVEIGIRRAKKGYQIVAFHDNQVYGVLIPKYQLGKRINLKLIVANDILTIEVSGQVKMTYRLETTEGCFFKAGLYFSMVDRAVSIFKAISVCLAC
jgi:hypothetical protein